MKLRIFQKQILVLTASATVLSFVPSAFAANACDRQTLAISIRDNGGIVLDTTHGSGVVDNANARQNIVDTAAGGQANRSAYETAPGGSVWLDPRLLDAMDRLSKVYGYTYRVSEIAGGSHSSGSYHYSGTAFDVYMINGSYVSSSNPYWQTYNQRCRDMGSIESLGPGFPGHDTHVHNAWPTGDGVNVAPSGCGPAPGTAWSGWYIPVAGFSASAPTITSTGNGTLSQFIRGGDGQIYQLKWTGSAWQGWTPLGGSWTGSPAACSRAAGQIDLVARDISGNIQMKNFNGTSWNSWYMPLSGYSADSPAIVSTGNGTLSVFIRSSDNQIYQLKWTGSAWQGWNALGGSWTAAPAACSRSAGQIDLVARDSSGNIQMRNFNGTSWNTWYMPLSGYSADSPGIVSTGSGTLSVFIRGGDNQIYQLKWTGSAWQGWTPLGGTWNSAPAACSRWDGKMDLVTRGTDNNIWMNNW